MNNYIQEITAVNPAHQKTVTKYLVADRKHVELEAELDYAIDGAESLERAMTLEGRKERRLDKTLTRVYDLWELLPKREQQNLDRQYKAAFGYGSQMGVN